MHQIAGKAVCFKEAMKPDFKDYAKQIKKNTEALAEGLRSEGLELVSGGTDNHLVLVDLRDEDATGKEAEKALEDSNIVVNKNAVPYDPEPPMTTSGVRLGVPALTTRGMKEEEMKKIGGLISQVLREGKTGEVGREVKEMLNEFPLYEDLEVEI